MATTTVSIRLDAADKSAMERACRELGLSMSAAFTIFAKKVGRERRIPFDVSVDPFYSEANLASLRASIAQLENGRGLEHELIEGVE